MERAKRSTESISPAPSMDLASSVPDSEPQIKRPRSIKTQVEKFQEEMRTTFDTYARSLADTFEVNEVLTVKREKDIRLQLQGIQSQLAEIRSRLDVLEKDSKKPAAPTPAAASIRGPATKPPALKRSDAVVLPPTSTGGKKKVEIAAVDDTWVYCVKCNVDGHECN